MKSFSELLTALTTGRTGEVMVLLHAMILVVLLTLAVRPNPPVEIKWPTGNDGAPITTEGIEDLISRMNEVNKAEREMIAAKLAVVDEVNRAERATLNKRLDEMSQKRKD